MKIDIDVLNSLLSIIGIYVIDTHKIIADDHKVKLVSSHKFKLVSRESGNEIYYVYSDTYWEATSSSTVEDIFAHIINCKMFAWDNISYIYKLHDNPYFGCRSLEEAFIKKDLMAHGD